MGFFPGGFGELGLPQPHPADGRGGLDTGRPAHVKCSQQATSAYGPRRIGEESALPIEVTALRRLCRPIAAQPLRIIGRSNVPRGKSTPGEHAPSASAAFGLNVKGRASRDRRMTGALLGAAPPLIIYAFLMDYYIAGLTAGATKG